MSLILVSCEMPTQWAAQFALQIHAVSVTLHSLFILQYCMYQLELLFWLLVCLQFMYIQYVYLSIVMHTNIAHNLRTPQLARQLDLSAEINTCSIIFLSEEDILIKC